MSLSTLGQLVCSEGPRPGKYLLYYDTQVQRDTHTHMSVCCVICTYCTILTVYAVQYTRVAQQRVLLPRTVYIALKVPFTSNELCIRPCILRGHLYCTEQHFRAHPAAVTLYDTQKRFKYSALQCRFLFCMNAERQVRENIPLKKMRESHPSTQMRPCTQQQQAEQSSKKSQKPRHNTRISYVHIRALFRCMHLLGANFNSFFGTNTIFLCRGVVVSSLSR